ncbi:MAG: class I SAM-dependent methyltransferase [Janthinobacterium lividum]
MATDETMNALLQEQVSYYRARANEYDEWFLRRGRYDRGPEMNARWFDESEQVRAALDAFAPTGRVLELACGTGQYTQQIAHHAAELTALDASPEVLAINRARVSDTKARYVQADILNWTPDGKFDAVFFGFWLSHVPPDRFNDFWELVSTCLAPGGRVFFVDSLFEPTSTAVGHQLERIEDVTQTRRLNDGQEFRIVKVFYHPEELQQKLNAMGWQFEVRATANYFLYGSGERK